MLKRLDLNLLPVLEILLEEQSVTAAAAVAFEPVGGE